MESMAEAAGVWQKSRDLLPQMLSLSLSPPPTHFKNKKNPKICDKGKAKAAIYTFSRNRKECPLGDCLATYVQLCLRDGWLPVGIRLF